jgi:hypothetical protein
MAVESRSCHSSTSLDDFPLNTIESPGTILPKAVCVTATPASGNAAQSLPRAHEGRAIAPRYRMDGEWHIADRAGRA